MFVWHKAIYLKCLVQIQKKSFVAEPAKSVVEGEIRTRCFIEEDSQPTAITGLEHLEDLGAVFVIACLEVAENDAAYKFIG